MAKDLNTLGPIESSVVVHPATHHWVDDSGQVLQPLVVPGGGHPPFGDGLPNRLGGLGTHRRKKAHEEFSPAILCPSRLEGVPEEVERNVLVLPRPVIVFAVDDPSLRRVKLQTALRKSTSDGSR